MAIRSHVDLCFFLRFVHVRRDQIPPNVLQTLRHPNPTTDVLADALIEQMATTTQITFHETYHFWQGLRLPFLHRYALLSFFTICQAFKKLSQDCPELHDWDCMLPELERLALQDKVWVVPDGGLRWGGYKVPIMEAVIGPLMLSPLDLLEGSTSLAEFQVHVSAAADLTSPKAFSRWRKRNPAYTEAYDILALYLEDETLSLRCFIPLVNAAFHTSEPVRAFAMLAGQLKHRLDSDADFKELLRLPEPCFWHQLFHDFLDDFEYEAAPDSDHKILGSPFHRLTLRSWVFDEAFPHPFLSPMARKWCESEDTDPVNTWLLDQPGWIVKKVLAQMVDFSPALSLVRFHIDGEHDRLISTGELPEGLQGPQLIDLMTLYSTVRRASGSHFDADSRLCHHNECPEYGPNFCNCFPKIPADYRACEFRHRVAALRESEWVRSIRRTP